MPSMRLGDNYVTDEDDYEQDIPHWTQTYQEVVEQNPARAHLRRYGILPDDEEYE
jgi:hypothetical protein